MLLIDQVLTQPAADGRPLPDVSPPTDASDDFFRVRMICTLLDASAVYLDRGSQRKRLDNFLVFFQVCRLPLAV